MTQGASIFQIETRERLPDFPEPAFDMVRMNQMVQILERRFSSVEDSLVQVEQTNRGILGGDQFAPIVHTHSVNEITDIQEFVDGQIALIETGDLANVNEAGVQPGHLFVRNPANDGWITLSPEASGFAFLPAISAPEVGDRLVYNGSDWVNQTEADTPFLPKAGGNLTGALNIAENVAIELSSNTLGRIVFDSVQDALTVGTTRTLDLFGGVIMIRATTGNVDIEAQALVALKAKDALNATVTGFEFDADLGAAINGQPAVAPPAYTTGTFTVDRAISNSGTATLAEVADVLSSLIEDLRTFGVLA